MVMASEVLKVLEDPRLAKLLRNRIDLRDKLEDTESQLERELRKAPAGARAYLEAASGREGGGSRSRGTSSTAGRRKKKATTRKTAQSSGGRRKRGAHRTWLRPGVESVLAGAKRPLTPAEIRDRLLEGPGSGDDPTNLYMAIFSLLNRDGGFRSSGDGWVLAPSGARRAKKTRKKAGKKRTTRKKGKRGKKKVTRKKKAGKRAGKKKVAKRGKKKVTRKKKTVRKPGRKKTTRKKVTRKKRTGKKRATRRGRSTPPRTRDVVAGPLTPGDFVAAGLPKPPTG